MHRRCLSSFLDCKDDSLNDFPKKFWLLSPRLCPPYPAIGIIIFLSFLSFEKTFLNPSLKLKKS